MAKTIASKLRKKESVVGNTEPTGQEGASLLRKGFAPLKFNPGSRSIPSGALFRNG